MREKREKKTKKSEEFVVLVLKIKRENWHDRICPESAGLFCGFN